jgi:glutamate carboxypeptidase
MRIDDGGSTGLSYFEAHRDEMLEFTRWLVEQESMSREADATRRIAERLGESLVSTGGSVELLNDARYGSTLRARFNHTGDESQNGGQLLVVGHLDTVWPIGTLATRPFRVEDDRAFGPGIFDMKSGVMLAAYAVRAIRELGRKTRRRTTLLMTCDEETGSHFSREIIEQEGRLARAALVMEPPIPGGTIKTGRKGVGEFELIIRGRAHAATIREPESAQSPSWPTRSLHQQTERLRRGTTVNGRAWRVLSNVIAAEAHAFLDIRFRTVDEGARIIEAMSNLQPVIEGSH